MKKIGSFVLLILLLVSIFGLSVTAAEVENVSTLNYITDDAGVLTADQVERLETRATELAEKYQVGVYVITVEDMYDYDAPFTNTRDDIFILLDTIYQNYDLGYGQDHSAVILLLSMADRDYYLEPYGFARTAFTDYGIDDLLDNHVLPKLGDNDWYSGFSAYLDRADLYLEMARGGTPFDSDTDPATMATRNMVKVAAIILIPLLIAFVVCSIWKRQMKTAVLAKAADNYIPQGGFKLTGQNDIFINRTTTRVKIQRQTTSGGGGGFRASGSSGRGGKF